MNVPCLARLLCSLCLPLLLISGAIASAETISYVTLVQTALGNPVTDVLILEEDATGDVHLTVHAPDVPSGTTTAIVHDPGFSPVKTLIIGLTEGEDAEGAPKTQIIAFLDQDFATANLNKKWSEIFVGSRHSVTITNILAAHGGDTTAQDYFTDEFYGGPAAGASFASGGTFVVGEFTTLNLGGSGAINGNWTVNSLTGGFITGTTTFFREAFLVDETASDRGVFDIKFGFYQNDVHATSLTTLNESGSEWLEYVIELGTFSATDVFVPSTSGDGLGFESTAEFPIEETTGAFPGVVVEEDRITFSGSLADQASANFVAHLRFTVLPSYPSSFSLRQYAITSEVTTLNIVGLSGGTLSLEVGNPLNALTYHLRCSGGLQGFVPLSPAFDFTSLTPQPLEIPVDSVSDPKKFFQVFSGPTP